MKRRIDEISRDNTVWLTLVFDSYTNFQFRRDCLLIQKFGRQYQRLRWNKWLNLDEGFEDIELRIEKLLAINFPEPNDVELIRWLALVRLMLPKIQKARADLGSKSWNWLSIKF